MKTKAPITLQDLRRKIDIKAKAEKTWRFWGIYVDIYKIETLQEAYKQVRRNRGAPGIGIIITSMIMKKNGRDASALLAMTALKPVIVLIGLSMCG